MIETASMASTTLASIGLVALTAFSQTNRHLSINRFSTLVGVVSIPLAIALLWRTAQGVGWWAIAVFVLASIAGGSINGLLSIRAGTTAPAYMLQPWLGLVSLLLASASWLV